MKKISIKIISIITLCAFVLNTCAWALAPEAALTKAEFKEQYLAKYALLAHEAVNQYIKEQIQEKGLDSIKKRDESVVIAHKEVPIKIFAIDGLLANTGQSAHVGLGRANDLPVIYIDSKHYYNEKTLSRSKDIIWHEQGEIIQWEIERRKRKLSYEEMREWIKNDPEAKVLQEEFHKKSYPLDLNNGISFDEPRSKNYVDIDSVYHKYLSLEKNGQAGLDKDDNDANIAARKENLTKTVPREFIDKKMTTGDKSSSKTMETYKEVPRVATTLIASVRKSFSDGYLSLNEGQLKALTLMEEEFKKADEITLLPDEYPEAKKWNSMISKYANWRDDIPIMLTHTFTHHRLMSIINYWENKKDFFAGDKNSATEKALNNFSKQVSYLKNQLNKNNGENVPALKELVYCSLKGNMADLTAPQIGGKHKEIIKDNAEKAASYISKGLKRVDVFVDNTAAEFLADLLLVNFLLKKRLAKEVVVHVKHHPFLISDVTKQDAINMIGRLIASSENNVKTIGKDLESFSISGQLKLQEDPWLIIGNERIEIPEENKKELMQSDLIVSKGDYLYRTFCGHYYHSYDSDINDAVKDLGLPPILFLRTMKVETALGLGSENVRKIEQYDPEWYKHGYGLIQLTEDNRKNKHQEEGIKRLIQQIKEYSYGAMYMEEGKVKLGSENKEKMEVVLKELKGKGMDAVDLIIEECLKLGTKEHQNQWYTFNFLFEVLMDIGDEAVHALHKKFRKILEAENKKDNSLEGTSANSIFDFISSFVGAKEENLEREVVASLAYELKKKEHVKVFADILHKAAENNMERFAACYFTEKHHFINLLTKILEKYGDPYTLLLKLEKYPSYSNDETAVFMIDINGKSIESTVNVGLVLHDDGVSVNNRGEEFFKSKDQYSYSLRGIVNEPISSEKGFVRLDTPPDIISFLNKKYDEDFSEEDYEKYHKALVLETERTVAILAEKAHPGKELILTDGIVNAFRAENMILPEKMSITDFLWIVNSYSDGEGNSRKSEDKVPDSKSKRIEFLINKLKYYSYEERNSSSLVSQEDRIQGIDLTIKELKEIGRDAVIPIINECIKLRVDLGTADSYISTPAKYFIKCLIRTIIEMDDEQIFVLHEKFREIADFEGLKVWDFRCTAARAVKVLLLELKSKDHIRLFSDILHETMLRSTNVFEKWDWWESDYNTPRMVNEALDEIGDPFGFLLRMDRYPSFSDDGMAAFLINTKRDKSIESDVYIGLVVHEDGKTVNKDGRGYVLRSKQYSYSFRGIIDQPISSEKGFIRLDTPPDAIKFLNEKYDEKFKKLDDEKYNKALIQETKKIVSILAEKAHPDKKLILTDGIISAFRKGSIVLPSEITVNKFINEVFEDKETTKEDHISSISFPEGYLTAKVIVAEKLGIHGRPAKEIAKLSEEYPDTEVLVINRSRGKEASWDSIVLLLALGASENTELTVCVKGKKEKEVLKKVTAILGAGVEKRKPKGSPASLLEMIKNDNDLLNKMINGEGVSVSEIVPYRKYSERTVYRECEILKDLGIFVNFDKKGGRYHFSDMMLGAVPKGNISENYRLKNIELCPQERFLTTADKFNKEGVDIIDLFFKSIENVTKKDEIIVALIGSYARFVSINVEYGDLSKDLDMTFYLDGKISEDLQSKIKEEVIRIGIEKGIFSKGTSVSDKFGTGKLFDIFFRSFDALKDPDKFVSTYRWEAVYFGTDNGTKRLNNIVGNLDLRLRLEIYIRKFIENFDKIKGTEIRDFRHLVIMYLILRDFNNAERIVKMYRDGLKAEQNKDRINVDKAKQLVLEEKKKLEIFKDKKLLEETFIKSLINTGQLVDPNYTGTMINTINDIKYQVGLRGDERPLHRGNIKKEKRDIVKELDKMTIINQANIMQGPVISENKTIWHILDGDILAPSQISSVAQKINNASRRSKSNERIWITKDGKNIDQSMKTIKMFCPDAEFDVALSSRDKINQLPDNIKMLVFEGEPGDFCQLGGVVAALRALHLEKERIVPALLQIYKILNNSPYTGDISDLENINDPKEFARRIIFNLPPAVSLPIDDISKLNDRLLEMLTAA